MNLLRRPIERLTLYSAKKCVEEGRPLIPKLFWAATYAFLYPIVAMPIVEKFLIKPEEAAMEELRNVWE